MSKQKPHGTPNGLVADSTPVFTKILTQVRGLIGAMAPLDRTSKDEIMETVDAVLQNSGGQRKQLESTIFLALETLQIFVEEGKEKQTSESEAKLAQEMLLLSKLLERIYIYSTDIEYAQFYNKELALRIDNVLVEKKLKLEGKLTEAALQAQVEQVFGDMEAKRVSYFKWAHKFEHQGAERADRRPKIRPERHRQLLEGGWVTRSANSTTKSRRKNQKTGRKRQLSPSILRLSSKWRQKSAS